MAKRNYREIQLEYLRRSAFPSKNQKRPFREYHMPEPIAEKLARLSRLDENGCHVWIGKINKRKGYGQIDYRENGRRHHRNAHTLAYELKNGPVPEGKEVSHICPGGANPRCVNPDHLVAETHSENLARRTWNPRGQRYKINCRHCGNPKERTDWSNSLWTCRECNAERAAKWRDKTGYDFNIYRAANKDRINENRRASRAKARKEGRKVT